MTGQQRRRPRPRARRSRARPAPTKRRRRARRDRRSELLPSGGKLAGWGGWRMTDPTNLGAMPVDYGDVYIIDALRTPIGKYGGALATVRTDDLAAHVIRAAVDRAALPADEIDDVYFGSSNQAGEDNRDVARNAALLAGLPCRLPGATVNRLCASGLEAVADAARCIAARRRRPVSGRRRRIDDARAIRVRARPARAWSREAPTVYDSDDRLALHESRTSRTRPRAWARPARTSPSDTASAGGSGRIRRRVASPRGRRLGGRAHSTTK